MKYKYFSSKVWNKLPFGDFRPRFFIETYLEKLSMYTPHFFQSRLMNTISAAHEVDSLIIHYRDNEKNISILRSSIDELIGTFGIDQVASDLFSIYKDQLDGIQSELRGENISHKTLQKLSLICRAITSRESLYEDTLLQLLRSAIIDPVDIKQKTRITSTIYSLTGLYATQLLNKGYSPTFLFNRAEYFTRLSNYAGRNFQDQFDDVTKKLTSRIIKYDIYFGIRVPYPQQILDLKGDPDFIFMGDLPANIRQSYIDSFKEGNSFNVIAYSAVEASDYISASWRAKERIDKFIDAYSALSKNQEITVLKNCLSMTAPPNVFTRVVNIGQIVGFLSSEGGTYFHTTNTTIRKAMQVLHPEGLDRLGRSLRYLRLARESISLEQKFLNLWISLESLFTGANASILTMILDYVPSLYAISTIKRRCIYLRDVLAANEIAITPLATQLTGETGTKFTTITSINSIYKIINNEPASIELFNSLGDLEHLKYKILTICAELKTNDSISQRIDRSISDVSRQIRRIYLLRNRITHTGHYEKIRPQLVTHLFDYVAVCYMAICDSAECVQGNTKYSVSDLLMAYKIGIDNRLKSCRENSSSPSVLANFEPIPLV